MQNGARSAPIAYEKIRRRNFFARLLFRTPRVCLRHLRASKRRRSLPNMDVRVGASPPQVPTHPLWRFQSTTFLVSVSTDLGPGTFLRSTQTCIEQLSKRCEVVRFKRRSSLKMHVTPLAGGQFLLKIKLYVTDSARGTWAVEFHKRRGCSVAFHHLFNALLRRYLRSCR